MTPTLAGSISRKALAATLAAALTFTTAGVAPARADGNGDAIAAAAFFGLVAAAIIASTRDRAARSPQPHPPAAPPRKLLPAECRFEIHYGADRGRWFGRNCLVANYAHWPRLPDRCARRVELPRRHYDVVAYKAQCLARAGYRPDDRGFR
ncbi:MAG TPA: hypothetical protein DIU07_10185 [Rhodobacteraceae bacterium]|nr:hypothetical protein [Paracoccaceae bacterium]